MAISAWFLVEQKFKSKRLLSLLCTDFIYVFIYGVIGFFVFEGTIQQQIRLFIGYWYKGVMYTYFHWFVIAYIMMCLLSPFINEVLKLIGQKWHRNLTILLAIFVLWPPFYGFSGNLGVFIFIYFIIAYIKKYVNYESLYRKYLYQTIVVASLLVAFTVLCAWISSDDGLKWIIKVIPSMCKTVLSPILAVLLVVLYACKPPKHNKTVCAISKTTFGIYLFHETFFYTILNVDGSKTNFSLIDIVLKYLTNVGFMKTDAFFIVRLLSITAVVFIVGFVVDMILTFVLQKPLMSFITKHFDNKLNKIDKWFNFENNV